MLQRSLVFGLAVMLFGAASIASAKADPRGLWLAEDGAKVRVSSCGGGLRCFRPRTVSQSSDESSSRSSSTVGSGALRLAGGGVIARYATLNIEVFDIRTVLS